MATKTWVGTSSGDEGDYGFAANWSPSGVPIAGDDVFFTNSSQDVDATLDQSAVLLGSFTVRASYTGEMALEGTFLQIQSPTVEIGAHVGAGSPQGSGRINLDLGSVTACTFNIVSTKTSATDTDRDPVRLINANASSALFMLSGKVSVADSPDQTATLTTVDVTTGDLSLSSGTTLVTVNSNGGTTAINSALTTLNISNGSVTTAGSGAITTANVSGGIFNSGSTGTITTLNALAGTTDFSGSEQARTVTTLTLSKASTVTIDTAIVTLTNDIQLDGLDPVTIRVD